MGRRNKPGNLRRYGNWGYFFIAPWIIGFCMFQLYPLIQSLWISLTNSRLLGETKFVGIKNYIDIFTRDVNFPNSVKVTLMSLLIRVPLRIIIALLFAILLNANLKGIGFYRTVYYLPSIFGGSVAISVVWRFLFMRDGLVNKIIGLFGIPAYDWLGSTDTALFIVSLVSVWQFGASMVIFLAGLKQVPEMLYEAAKIDGANRIQRFFRITIPQISPVLFFNIIMQTINALQEFTIPFLITKGGPAKSTYLLSMMIYENGFKFFKMGYASALSWIMFLFIITISVIYFATSKYWVHYND